jgi:hypothetical protein
VSDDKEIWSIRATLNRPHISKAAPFYLGRRESDGAWCILKQIGRDWQQHGPPVNVEMALRTAEHVAAGNPQALTWPDAMLVMATAILATHAAAHPVEPEPAAAAINNKQCELLPAAGVANDVPASQAGGIPGAPAGAQQQVGAPSLFDAQHQSCRDCGG